MPNEQYWADLASRAEQTTCFSLLAVGQHPAPSAIFFVDILLACVLFSLQSYPH